MDDSSGIARSSRPRSRSTRQSRSPELPSSKRSRPRSGVVLQHREGPLQPAGDTSWLCPVTSSRTISPDRLPWPLKWTMWGW